MRESPGDSSNGHMHASLKEVRTRISPQITHTWSHEKARETGNGFYLTLRLTVTGRKGVGQIKMNGKTARVMAKRIEDRSPNPEPTFGPADEARRGTGATQVARVGETRWLR